MYIANGDTHLVGLFACIDYPPRRQFLNVISAVNDRLRHARFLLSCRLSAQPQSIFMFSFVAIF